MTKFLQCCGILVYSVAVSSSELHIVYTLVAGDVGQEVSMECGGTNPPSSEFAWSFRPPYVGPDEVSIPGRYRKETTGDGRNRLIIEDLKFADCGTYVCRDATSTGTIIASYILVVTGLPHCYSNLTVAEPDDGTPVRLTCWIAYAGTSDVRLTMIWENPDGHDVKSTIHKTTTTGGLSVHGLSWDIHARPPYLLPYECLMSFKVITRQINLTSHSSKACISPERQVPVRAVPFATESNIPSASWLSSPRTTTISELSAMERQNADIRRKATAAAAISALTCAVLIVVCVTVCCGLLRQQMADLHLWMPPPLGVV